MAPAQNTLSKTRIANNSPFYSPLQNAIASVPDRLQVQPAGQWLAWLRANAGKLGVKQDEVTWSGIEDYLVLRGRERVGKDEIAGFLRDNGVRVQEVVKGDVDEGLIEEFLNDEAGEGFNREDAIEYLRNDQENSELTKYSRYVLPGGENYREMLLTLPGRGHSADAELAKLQMQLRDARGATANEILANIAALREGVNSGKLNNEFKSAHWDEPNVIAHVRFNDRTDADGNKVLFIEELQSDWGQEGKKQGFGYRDTTPLSVAEDKELMDLYDLRGNRTAEQATRMHQLNNRLNASQGKSGIPTGPFVTDTKAWLSLGVKRMIAYAAENNYDSVAFINGGQAADLYDLSKQVDQIRYIKKTNGTFDVWAADEHGGSLNDTVDKQGLTENQIEEFVGKDVAKKIVEGAGRQDGGDMVLSGLDLRVGGEGMAVFYDQIVPQVVNDVLRKLGGGKLEQIRLDGHATYEQLVAVGKRTGLSQAELDALPVKDRKALIDSMLPAQRGFEITPALRERVLNDGLPLFQDDRGALDTKTLTMTLFENADESTFIHESGHFYLEVMSDIAGQANPPAQVTADMAAVLDWLKVPGGMAAWKQMPMNAEPPALCKRPFHEQFARGMEAYLMTGKAPTPETEGLFARAAKFLANVYHSIKGLDVELTPKITSVFDRLVVQTSPAIQQETDIVRQGLESQLTAIDRFPADVNRTYAGLVANFYGNLAGAAGMSATELAEKYPVQIRSDVNGLVPGGITKTRTDTPEFKAWFGDSKVVDGNSDPLVVYHGTAGELEGDTFDISRSGQNFSNLELGKGFLFFTNDSGKHGYPTGTNAREYANYAAALNGKEAKIINVHLRMENPLIISAEGWGSAVSAFDKQEGDIRRWIAQGGHDGAIVENYNNDLIEGADAERLYVVLDPAQIKSVFNRGSFDRSDPSILHQAALHSSPQHFETPAPPPQPLPEGVKQVNHGLRIGAIKDITPNWVIQDAGRGDLVGYPRTMFDCLPEKDKCVQISCKDGKAVVKGMEANEQGRGR